MPGWLASAAVSPEQEQRLQAQYPAYRGVDSDYVHAGADALDRWMDWKWGLRIHWGLYCMFDGRESWIIPDHRQDVESYRDGYTADRKALEEARDGLRAAGLQVSGCVTTTQVGKKSTGWPVGRKTLVETSKIRDNA